MARKPRQIKRSGERIPLHAPIHLTSEDGKPMTSLARCTNIGLGGLRVTAATGVKPGTVVHVELRLPTGRLFHAAAHVTWLMTTHRPALLSTPTGRDDDARFGLAFDECSTQTLLPIARLLVARADERRRARRIRRRQTSWIHA